MKINYNIQIRQGELLLLPIDELPKGLKEKNKILAYGEVTGHKHQFKSENVHVFENQKKEQYVNVEVESELLHEEHMPVSIPKGLYVLKVAREYDIVEGVTKVTD